MSVAQRSWLAIGMAAVLVLGVFATALVVTDHRTPAERGAIAALEPVAERPDGHIGVVVLGTSLSRNALSTHGELGAALAAAGLGEVAAANLSVPVASMRWYREVLDHVWAANPDILVIEPGIFLSRPFEHDRSLRTRISQWFESAEPVDINASICRPRSDRLWKRNLGRIGRALIGHDSTDNLERLRAFLNEAETRVDRIVWVVPPKSAIWTEAVGGRHLVIERQLIDAAADLGVSPVAPIKPPPLDHYCDFSHLNLDGAQQFLETWATATVKAIVEP